MTFFDWLNNKAKETQHVVDWLNANAGHIATDWELAHTGGMCTAYIGKGKFKGRDVTFYISNDLDASPHFSAPLDMWGISATADECGTVWNWDTSDEEGDLRILVDAFDPTSDHAIQYAHED